MKSSNGSISTRLSEAYQRTKPYLFSHHVEPDEASCFKFGAAWLCARCTGVYLGIVAGLGSLFLGVDVPFWIVPVLPCFALLDYAAVHTVGVAGNRYRAALTGILLGFAYLTAFSYLLLRPLTVIGIGAVYGAAALCLLTASK